MNLRNEQIIRAYFKALEDGIPVERFGEFFHAEAYQVEFPSRLNPNGKAGTKRKCSRITSVEKASS